jgi:hypothetical protein
MFRKLSLIVLSATLLAAGCHKADVKDYVPPEEAARKALSAALDAWKEGKTPDQVGAANPKIEVQDKQWSGGKKLSAYEIVGPTTGPDQNARFQVKLTFPDAAKETTYIVLGKDPIWVFSEESYQRTSGM